MQRTDTSSRTCCNDGPCDSGLRNHYFEGKRLTADSFRVEQSYLLERRRLLNRAIHGWGVVHGYGLKAGAGALEVRPGLALDESGRELVLTRAKSVGFDDVLLLDGRGGRLDRVPDDCDPRGESFWLLSVHYAEQDVGPMRVNDPCNCERKEWDHVCETVRFSLRRVDRDECCKHFDCELKCGCGTGPCCDEQQHERDREQDHEKRERDAPPVNPVRRGECQCLCEYLTGLSDEDCGRLKEIEEPCGRVRVDLHNGVALACVRLCRNDCDEWSFDHRVEDCGPRRLVKRNDVLFDLIRGCDLTRISAIGWAPWHRACDPIRWEDFQDSFGSEEPPRSGESPTKAYWVEFSRPVRRETVRADCFSMTVIAPEDEGGWGIPLRVPIVGVAIVEAPGGQSGLITRATLVVDAAWVSDAILSRKRIFNHNETRIEIEIRGDYIVDCNGQTIDANAVGLSPAPTGNGTPGGTFHSSFSVHSRESRPRPYDPEQSNRAQGA